MNKTILILFVLFLSFCAQAQRHSIGFLLGSGLTSTKQPEGLGECYIVGYYADFNYQFQLNRFFSLRTGLAYEQKGSQGGILWCPMGEDRNPYNIHFDYSYATLPILVNFHAGKHVIFNTYLGGYYSLLLKTELADYDQFRSDYLVSIADNHNNHDYGIIWGLGIEVPISDRFSIPLEYKKHLGLANICAGRTEKHVMHQIHEAFYVTLGLRFKLN